MPVYGFAEDLLQFREFFLHDPGGLGFEVQAQQRLGVALADVEPPVAEIDGDAVQIIHLILLVRVGQLADFGRPCPRPGN